MNLNLHHSKNQENFPPSFPPKLDGNPPPSPSIFLLNLLGFKGAKVSYGENGASQPWKGGLIAHALRFSSPPKSELMHAQGKECLHVGFSVCFGALKLMHVLCSCLIWMHA